MFPDIVENGELNIPINNMNDGRATTPELSPAMVHSNVAKITTKIKIILFVMLNIGPDKLPIKEDFFEILYKSLINVSKCSEASSSLLAALIIKVFVNISSIFPLTLLNVFHL
jgi:hypothetical protein